jgi:hypothetical protein
MNRILLKRYRLVMMAFIILLALSGITAIPVEIQLEFLMGILPADSVFFSWIEKVYTAYREVKNDHPFLLYGYDWLAFAHIIIAIFFIGAYSDPVRNIWIIKAGLIACFLVFPLAFIAGFFRGIPWGWQLIDCSFGLFGAIPLYYCYRIARKLEIQQQINQNQNQNGNDYSNRLVKRQTAG